jgi:hypothetical protein
MSTIPDYVLRNAKVATRRLWKALKRRQLRALDKAVDDLRMGCAYFPDGAQRVETISKEVAALRRELSAMEWGR